MLIIKVIKNESNLLGTKVRALAKSLLEAQTLHTFAGNFNSDMAKMDTGNHLKGDLQYYAKVANEFTNNETVEIYHRNSMPGKNDSLIITINK